MSLQEPWPTSFPYLMDRRPEPGPETAITFSLTVPAGRSYGSVRPEDAELSNLGALGLPDLYSRCNEPVLLMLTGAPDRLFLAEAFGFNVDRRNACPDAALGGIYEIRLSAGGARRIAGSLQVNRMLASPDGRDLYVLESSSQRAKGADRLLRIDTGTGSVVQTAQLLPGRWTLALAHVPLSLIPQGKERAVTYCSR